VQINFESNEKNLRAKKMRFEGIAEIFQYDDDGLIIGSMFVHRKKK